jgi:predicted RNA binding protein YcfA (HicA-like mRNA interferase family)
MTKLSPLRARQVVRGLRALGFEKVRQKGSHAIFHHRDCRRASIPIHPGKTISPYLLSDVVRQLDIDEDDFIRAIGR